MRTLLIGVVVFIAVAVVVYFIAKPEPRIIDGQFRRSMPMGAVIIGMFIGGLASVATMIIDRIAQHAARKRAINRLEAGQVDGISLR